MALGGVLGLFLHRLIEPEVGKAVADGLGTPVEPVAAKAQGDPTDLILAAALLSGALVFGTALHVYRLLRRRATEAAGRLSGRVVARSLLVRWFHDSAKMGMLIVFIGAWLCFGAVMQIVGLVVMLVPLPASVMDLPLEWATPAMTAVLVAVGALMFGAMLGGPIWMAIRHFKLDIRYYRGNRRFRFLANAGATVTAGLVGALVFVSVLDRLGVLPPSRSGDLLYGVIPGLWLLAYLIVCAIEIIVQARKRGGKFNLANIALACVLAPFGAVPLFALLWRVRLHFYSRLLS